MLFLTACRFISRHGPVMPVSDRKILLRRMSTGWANSSGSGVGQPILVNISPAVVQEPGTDGELVDEPAQEL